jgi:hypothetical protein
MAIFRDTDTDYIIETRQVTPSTRRPESPYAVEAKTFTTGLDDGIAVLLSPEEAIRFALDLIQKAESVREEQAFMARQQAKEESLALTARRLADRVAANQS